MKYHLAFTRSAWSSMWAQHALLEYRGKPEDAETVLTDIAKMSRLACKYGFVWDWRGAEDATSHD